MSSLPPSDAADLANRLRAVVVRLNRLLRQHGDAALTPTKLVHLAAIDRHGPLALGELATREGVAPATVTKVVAQLEEQGLIVREVDPADRRVVRVRISDAGHDLMTRTRTRSIAWLTDQLTMLSDGEAQRLGAALDVLEEVLRAAASGAETAATRERAT